MPTPLISLLLPTRGRPALVARLFESIRTQTLQLHQIEVVLYVDEDDPQSHALNHKSFQVTKIIGPRVTMGTYNSACLERAQGEIAVLINDDMVIRTVGWDELVRDIDRRFADKIYLGYGNDLFKGRKLCSFPILSRRTCEILVDPFPRFYRGAFIDYHLLDIFKRLECAGYPRICYLESLIFEHLHYRAGKAAFDETYRNRNRFSDDPVFLNLRSSRSVAAKRLCSVIENTPFEVNSAAPSEATDPRNLFAALFEYWEAVVRDRELPLRWRGFLYLWFLGRYVASRGHRWVHQA